MHFWNACGSGWQHGDLVHKSRSLQALSSATLGQLFILISVEVLKPRSLHFSKTFCNSDRLGLTPQISEAGFAVCKGPGHVSGMQGQGEVFKGETVSPWPLGRGFSFRHPPAPGNQKWLPRLLPTQRPAVREDGLIRSKGGTLPGCKISQQSGWVIGGGRSGQERVQRGRKQKVCSFTTPAARQGREDPGTHSHPRPLHGWNFSFKKTQTWH